MFSALAAAPRPAQARMQGASASVSQQVSPSPGQYYAARARVMSNASVAAGATVTVKVTGVGGVPASGVSTVALNLSAKGASAAGGLIAFPSTLAAAPAVTGARYRSAVWDNHLLMVKVGTDGQIKVKNTGSAAVNVYADVHGYFTGTAAATEGASYVPLDTARIIGNQSVPANSSASFTAVGVGGIPATGVAFVALTLIVKSTGSGKVIVHPSGGALPTGSNIDYRPPNFLSNLVIVAPGADGKITVNNNGAAALTVYADVAGYFAAPAAAGTASTGVAVDPARIVNNVSVPAGAVYTVAPLGKGGVPASGVSSVGVNLTAQSTAGGLLRVYPTGQASIPGGGSIAFQAGDFWANFVPVKLGADGTFAIKNTGTAAITLAVDTFSYFTAGGKPAAPTGVTATGGDASATVSWQAPVDDGGSPIIGYTVMASPGGATTSVGASRRQAVVSGLTNGTAYTFTVTAANAVGSSPASVPSASIKVGRVPGAPTNVIATAASGSVSVSWSAPADSGTSPITAYTVAEASTGKTETVGTTAALFTSLANGQRYSFRVKATNDTGDSAWSAISNVISPQPLPVPERSLIIDADPGDGQVRLTWAPPPSGGEAVTTYRISIQPGDRTVEVAGDATSTVVKSVDNGTAYTFTIVAVNGNGASQPSLPAQATPRPGQAPLPPVILRTVPGDGRITLQWLPAGDGGAPLTGYTLSAHPDGPTVNLPADAMSGTLTGLVNGTAYSVRLTSANAIGTGEASLAGQITPAARQAPGPPADLEATAVADGQVEVIWTPPTFSGSVPISAYTVLASPGGTSVTQRECTSQQERCSAVVTGLDPATEYTFTATATSADGTSPASAATAPIRATLRMKAEAWQLSPAAAQTLTAVRDDGTLIFDNAPAEVAELTPGRYVIIPATPAAPDGLIRKIVTVSTSGNRVSLATVPATLTDLLTEGDLAGEVTLDGHDLAASSNPPGPAARATDGEIPAGPPLRFPLHQSIGASGRLDADLVLTPKLVYNLKIRAGTVSGRIALHNQLTGPIRLHATHQANWTRQFSLGRHRFNRMLKVGRLRIPIVVTHVLTATANADASGALTLSGNAAVTSGVEAAITGRNGGISPVFTDHTVANPPVLNGSGSARLGLTGSEFISLAGTIGIGAEVNPYLAAQADVAANPWWWIRAGAMIRGCFSWFDTCTPAQVSKDLFVTLKTADGPFRGISITPPHATTGRNQPVDFNTVTHNAADGPVQWKIIQGPGSIDHNGVYVSATSGQAVVRATREGGGVDDPTAEATVEVDPHVPQAPVDVKAAGAPLSANVSWQPPPDSLVGITGFAVVATPLDQGQVPVTAFAGSSERGLAVYGLAPGVPYAVQVYATSQNAVSSPSGVVGVIPTKGLGLHGDSRNLAVDANGNPDIKRDSARYVPVISGDGRYAFFAVAAGSNLMPAEAYEPGSDALYLLRKDVDTGEIKLVSRRPDGRTPAPVDPSMDFAVAWDGSRAAYITLPDGSVPTSPLPKPWRADMDLIVSDIEDGDVWVVHDGTAETVPIEVDGISGDGEIALFMIFRESPDESGESGNHELIRAEREGNRRIIAQDNPGDLWSGGDISADGDIVVFTTLTWRKEEPNIWELKLYRDSTKKYETSLRALEDEPYENLHWARISADGTTLTYSAMRGQDPSTFTAFTKKVTAVGTWGTPVAQGAADNAPAMSAHGRFIGYSSYGAVGGVFDIVAGSATVPQAGGSLSLTYDGSAGVVASRCRGGCEGGVWYQRYNVPGLRGDLQSCNNPDYGYIGEHGRRTGMRVKLCFPMPEGSPASTGIKPPGFPAENERIPDSGEWRYARGHLLAAQLGGSGSEPRNLVAMFQLANRVLMDPEEDKVRYTVDDGEELYYYVAPVYTDSPPADTEQDLSKRMPDKIHIVASGDNGFFLDACIPNVEGGTVTYDDPCTA
ncbi:fibronectin type III domain-containing protein [Nonomuraea basaltis]|uniref:fibronectin type III domain-containing protein n=1 Tax=Nonomuraea basaltis TaxID=2495887 RepID=UPI001F0F12D5|nr:fibronectin type III domain-containing protein [Nonomuraea basaltis]